MEENNTQAKSNSDNAFFSLRREDLQEDGEYFYIRANTAGLRNYAELLNNIANEIEQKNESTKVKLPKDNWIKGDITLDFVETINDAPTSSELLLEPTQNVPEQSKLFNIGCVTILIILVTAMIVGIITIIKWI